MDVEDQLAHLAQLLRITAERARRMGQFRQRDSAEILWLCHQIEDIADGFEKISGVAFNVIPISSRKQPES